jgi:peptidoglycan/xylan/chitin deacetylase (PgdA/CDA1 family)
MKHTLKRLVGRTLFESRLNGLLLRNAALVVAFHRVRDTEEADELTVGVDMFERYCRFFRRHFRVTPLRELVDRLERGRVLDGELAITFDDGYRDNFDNAAPVLERLGLPATFFVVSQWMGTDVVPWWDEGQRVRHPWMTWAQIRSLRRRGFDIGAHTRTHVDLGRISALEAKEEIVGARIELEEHLREPVDLFAYPYGGRDNLVGPYREIVKAAGFRCCCSSFGGFNPPGTDPFQLRRVPISSWYHSPHQFGLDVALRRTVLTG